MRFPRSQSIADDIRKRWGDKSLKKVKKFERLDDQVKKYQLDIEFVKTCHKYNVFPNFLRIRITNKTLKDSLTYRVCQQIKHWKIHWLTLNISKQELQYQLSPIDFIHVSSLSLESNDIKWFVRITRCMIENYRIWFLIFMKKVLLIMFDMILIK